MGVMSPELVLVDETLRPAACAALPETPDGLPARARRRADDPIRQLRAAFGVDERLVDAEQDSPRRCLGRGLVVSAICACSIAAIALAFMTAPSGGSAAPS